MKDGLRVGYRRGEINCIIQEKTKNRHVSIRKWNGGKERKQSRTERGSRKKKRKGVNDMNEKKLRNKSLERVWSSQKEGGIQQERRGEKHRAN